MMSARTCTRSADPNECAALCATKAQCVGWVMTTQQCGPGGQAVCWLKAELFPAVYDNCSVAGEAARPARLVRRPYLNGGFLFLNGWLDQSFWPDGLFTAPTDAALAYDLELVKRLGYNTVRLHQKVNSERW